jgi:hypothetical protein
MTNHDVVKKLIGKISPTAESNTDAERLENLKAMCHLAEMILMDIDDVRVRNIHDNHGSVKKIAEYAANFLNVNVRDLIAP